VKCEAVLIIFVAVIRNDFCVKILKYFSPDPIGVTVLSPYGTLLSWKRFKLSPVWLCSDSQILLGR